MKPLMLIFGMIVSGAVIYSVQTTEMSGRLKGNIKSDVSPYQWHKIVEEDKGRFPEKWAEGTWPMGIIPLIGFDQKLWMIGQDKSWSSENGTDWTAYPKADWGERHSMSFVFFKDKLWMTAGMKNWGDFRNDIWNTSDGKNWKRTTQHAPWSERVRHKTIVFKNKLWLIGGTIGSGDSKKLPAESLHDIWSSEDGIIWTQEVKQAPWSMRYDPKVVVFKNKLWLISGVDQVGGKGQQDVWNSSDGKNWTRVTSTAPWEGRRNEGVLVFDNQLWIFGGVEKNDVWSSADGVQWKQVFEHAPWSTRTAENSIVFKNRLLIYSGKTGREDSWSGDVWALSR